MEDDNENYFETSSGNETEEYLDFSGFSNVSTSGLITNHDGHIAFQSSLDYENEEYEGIDMSSDSEDFIYDDNSLEEDIDSFEEELEYEEDFDSDWD